MSTLRRDEDGKPCFSPCGRGVAVTDAEGNTNLVDVTNLPEDLPATERAEVAAALSPDRLLPLDLPTPVAEVAPAPIPPSAPADRPPVADPAQVAAIYAAGGRLAHDHAPNRGTGPKATNQTLTDGPDAATAQLQRDLLAAKVRREEAATAKIEQETRQRAAWADEAEAKRDWARQRTANEAAGRAGDGLGIILSTPGDGREVLCMDTEGNVTQSPDNPPAIVAARQTATLSRYQREAAEDGLRTIQAQILAEHLIEQNEEVRTIQQRERERRASGAPTGAQLFGLGLVGWVVGGIIGGLCGGAPWNVLLALVGATLAVTLRTAMRKSRTATGEVVSEAGGRSAGGAGGDERGQRPGYAAPGRLRRVTAQGGCLRHRSRPARSVAK